MVAPLGYKIVKGVLPTAAGRKAAEAVEEALLRPHAELPNLRAQIEQLRAEIQAQAVTQPEGLPEPNWLKRAWQRFTGLFSRFTAKEPLTTEPAATAPRPEPAAAPPAPRAAASAATTAPRPEPAAAPPTTPTPAEKLQAMEARLAQREAQLPFMTGMTFKFPSLSPQGREYAQVRSPLVMGQKHPTVEAAFPRRGEVPVPEYVQRVQKFAVEYNPTMQHKRSPFVSPRLAVNQRGLSPEEALRGYRKTYHAFTRPVRFEHLAVSPELTRDKLAEGLANSSVHTKVLQNGEFRIKVQHNPTLGPVTVKLPMEAGISSGQHLDKGLETAVRLHKALQPDAVLSKHLSPKILRTNALTKRVNLKELTTFEQAKATFSDPAIQQRIGVLQAQGFEVKVLRDMTFRIIRRNAKGEIAKEYRLALRTGEGMPEFINRSLTEAERKAGKPLPEKLSLFRQLKNEFRPLKKAFTDL